jgi:uncharacterized protein (TIGR02266 family)
MMLLIVLEDLNMALFCPFCSDKITPATTECLSCVHTFSSHTLSFLELSCKAQDTYPHENRKQVRFPLKLRVVSYTPEAFIHHYTSNLSLGGLFIETNAILSPGKKFDLKMFLFDAAGPMEIPCEVAWSRQEEKQTPTGKLPQGMGVKFLDLSMKKIEGLIDISNRSLS